MANWNTMHIFGYGESQMIGPDKNGKVANDTLTTIAPLIAYLASIQQQGTDISMETLYALNIFNEQFIDFLPNNGEENEAQRFKWTDIDLTTVNNFADELANAIPAASEEEQQMMQGNYNLMLERLKNQRLANRQPLPFKQN